MFLMIEQIIAYFTLEMIYMWLNIGVIPFWLALIFFPQLKICKIFIASIFPSIIFSTIYCYLFYLFFKNGYDFIGNFELYLSIDKLTNLLTDSSFLILFWIHFLAINLFCGGWIANDSQKFGCSRILIFFPMVITYFVGPLGIALYWLIRIFYAKKITLYD